MILLYILLTNLLLTNAEINSVAEYCDITSQTCNEETETETVVDRSQRFLFYDVNPPEGFNLRRDVYMRFAIMMAEAQSAGKKNWQLVLPPWYNLYHWRTDRRKPKFWSDYFDVKSLKTHAPVVEIHEVFSQTKKMVLEIDTVYVLQNFEDAFENGIFEEKWKIVGECEYDGHFWGYQNITAKEVICVKFQGKNSKLWELMAQHPTDTKVMFAHGEIPLHDSYGTKSYWDCRKSMKFNKKLIKIAEKYMKNHLNCDIKHCTGYISVHWRRQDFARSRGNDVPSIASTAKQIHKVIQKKIPLVKNIFIATDASIAEIDKLQSLLSISAYNAHFFLPSEKILQEHGDGGVAIIDQIICSHGAYFIGTHESTFTYRIQEEREILGFDSDTTFNRLCPDSGYCEKPTKWTII